MSDYDPLDDPYFSKIEYRHNSGVIASYSSDGTTCDRFGYTYSRLGEAYGAWPQESINMQLGDKLHLEWVIHDCQGSPDKEVNEISATVYPGIGEIPPEFDSSYNADTLGNIHVRPHISCPGMAFDRWLRYHPLPEVKKTEVKR